MRTRGLHGLASAATPPGTVPGGNRARSDALLRSARLALAVTDVRRASDLVAQARQEQIRYAPNEDSPERVEAAIARFVEVSRLDRSTEENRKTYARMLMEQSEALLQWGELEQADKLAALAVEQQVTYGPFDAKPEDLLRRIAALRQQNNPAGPRQIDTAIAGPNAVGPSLAGRQQAVELMRQIRGALAAGQIAPGGIPLPPARCPADPGKCLRAGRGPPGTGLPGRSPGDGPRRLGRGSGRRRQPGPIRRSRPARLQSVARCQPATCRLPICKRADSVAAQAAGDLAGRQRCRSRRATACSNKAKRRLKARDRDRALQLFQQAAAYSNDLDPVTAERLQDHLSLLSVPRGGAAATGSGEPSRGPAAVDEVAAAQQALLKEVFADVSHREAEAKRMLEKDPKMALAMLQETRKKVESAGLDPADRDQLLRRLDHSIADTQHYIEQNRSRIELDEKNNAVRRGHRPRSRRQTANAAEAGRAGRPVQPAHRGAALRGGRGHRQAGPGTRAPRDGHPSHGQQDLDPHQTGPRAADPRHQGG